MQIESPWGGFEGSSHIAKGWQGPIQDNPLLPEVLQMNYMDPRHTPHESVCPAIIPVFETLETSSFKNHLKKQEGGVFSCCHTQQIKSFTNN